MKTFKKDLVHMVALIIGIIFLISGVIFFLLVLFKYTEEEHQKELKKYQWVEEIKHISWFNMDLVIFKKIANNSYIITKVIMILIAVIPIVIGILAL
jgi:hypothetical protein